MSGGGDRPLKCDGWCDGENPVTHIGSKGYAYCAECGKERRESGYESTRRMRAWELAELRAGRALPSYAPQPKPVPATPALTPYDTGAVLEPKLYVTSTAGLTRDNADDFGKVDFDDDQGTTHCAIVARPSTGGDTLIHIDTLGGDTIKVVLDGFEMVKGHVFDPDGTLDCPACDTGERGDLAEVARLAEVAFAAADGDSNDDEIQALQEALSAALAALGIEIAEEEE